MNLHDYINTVEDFPEEGVNFQDISPMLKDPEARIEGVKRLADLLEGSVDSVAGLDARGFIYGPPVADELEVPFYMIRKEGKLPGTTETQNYGLEYGENSIEVNPDSIGENESVALVDDLLATGGTMEAAAHLIEKAEGEAAYCATLIELEDLEGRTRLENQGYEVGSVLKR